MGKKSAKSSRSTKSLRVAKVIEDQRKPIHGALNGGSDIPLPGDYRQFVEDLINRIRAAQISVSRSVNRELILLYWDLGQAIVEKQRMAGWGDAVVERVATELRAEFPDIGGFSNQNVWRMRQFYRFYSASEFLSQAVRELRRLPKSDLAAFLEQTVRKSVATKAGNIAQTEILSQAVRELITSVPWGHHVNVLFKVEDHSARLYYLRATTQFGWSRNVLLNQVKARAFERAKREKKTHNFELALPTHLAEQANEILKSSYSLEFLGVGRVANEWQLENRLIESVQEFILELGYGFCFVGRQYRLVLGSKEYFVDLLFYHRFLKALVALDLKIRGFIPEDAGKMDFYLNVLNDQERGPDDQPSIGIILCAEKEDIEVEYALKSKTNPIGVAQYKLQAKLPADLKGKLPTAKQLADAVRRGLLTGK